LLVEKCAVDGGEVDGTVDDDVAGRFGLIEFLLSNDDGEGKLESILLSSKSGLYIESIS
jgi:hypothetical protein